MNKSNNSVIEDNLNRFVFKEVIKMVDWHIKRYLVFLDLRELQLESPMR